MAVHSDKNTQKQAQPQAQAQVQPQPQAVQPQPEIVQPTGQVGFDPNNPYAQPGFQQPGFQQPGFQQPGFQQPGFQGYQGVDFQSQQFNGFGKTDMSNNATQRIARLTQALAPTIQKGGTSERAAAFVKLATEILEADKTNVGKYRLITLSPESDGVALNTVAIARHAVNPQNQDVVVIHSLIVEGGKIEPRKFNIAGFHQQQIQIESTAGDTYTETYWQILVSKLSKFYPNARFEDGHANIIAAEVELKETTDVRNILAAATIAVDNTLALFTDPNRFVLTSNEIRSDQELRLTSTLDFNPTEALTSNQLPIRSDIAITTGLVPVANMLSRDFTNAKINIVTTDVFLDLAYVGNANQGMAPNMFGYNPYMMGGYKTYAPRVVITNIDSGHVLSTEMLVLGIINATLLSNQQAWIAGFRNKVTSSGGPGIRNIASVGFEVPGLVEKPGLVDLSAVSIPELVNTVCHDQLIYSMDVPEIGDNSYIQNIFIAAANGDQGAYNSIIQACNNLTNNVFGQLWQPTNAILLDDKNRIHNGYFYFDNKKVDFRELDYLAILGLFGERNMENVIAYANTFRPDGSTELQRLEERYRILQLAEGAGHMHLKGYSRRLTFTSQFIATLLTAFTQAGLSVTLDSGLYDNTTQRRYAVDALQQIGFNPMAAGVNIGSMFNTPMNTGGPNWAYARPSGWTGYY